VTEIEVAAPPGGDDGGEGRESPYGNLLVPLVVVPFLIGLVLVLVFVLFGALAGGEATPAENLDRMLHGGRNEREQAEFNLVRQLNEIWVAEAAGETSEWSLPPELLPVLQDGWIATPEDEVGRRLVLAHLLSRLDDPDGLSHLIELTQASAAVDPTGEIRLFSVWALGSVGLDLGGEDQGRVAAALIDLTAAQDVGMRSAAVMWLHAYPGEETLQALRGMLSAQPLDVRINAAISLARHGDPSGAETLLEAVRMEPYERERAKDPTRWSRGEAISQSRRLALETLGLLDPMPGRAFLESVAEEDQDPNVREAALRLLAGEVGRQKS